MAISNRVKGLLVGAIGGALIGGGGMRLLMASGPEVGRDRIDVAPRVEEAEEEVRVLEALRAELDEGLRSWYSGDPFGYAALYAEDLSYFDPGTGGSLHGLDSLRAHYRPLVGLFDVDRYEVVGPRLQLHGDIAILTFILNEHEAGDPPSLSWKVTHVYRRSGDEWRVIHGHFSPANTR